MGLINLDISRDGFIKASDLQEILLVVAGEIVARFEDVDAAIERQDAEIEQLRNRNRKLTREIETERRLRLGMKSR